MKKYNVVLLGGSNSVMVNGLQKGLRQENVNLTNLALGSTTSIQNLYELKRERNQKSINEADLIITESNVNEIGQNINKYEKLSLNLIYSNLYNYYSDLSCLNKKILVILLPTTRGNYKIINNIHLKLIKQFKFNYIDMNYYYNINRLYDFHNAIDAGHPLSTIMKNIGQNIINSIEYFQYSIKTANKQNKFIICHAGELEVYSGKTSYETYKNSMYNEEVVKIDNSVVLKFPKKYHGCKILAIHTWNKHDSFNFKQCLNNIVDYCIQNKDKCILKSTNFLNSVVELQADVIINNDTKFFIYQDKVKKYTEFYHAAQNWSFEALFHNNLSLVGFFLMEGNMMPKQIGFEAIANENIEIPKEYNFNHLIPPVELYKEIIDGYCQKMDPKKLAPLQTQITNLTNEKQNLISEKINLQNQLNQFQNTLNSLPIKKQQLEISNLEQDLINKKLQTKQLSKKLGIKMNDFMPKITMINPNSAKARIQNQLSYKLGQAMIANSKSILGYIRMPFVLSYIKDKHKLEQKIYQEKIKKDPSLVLPFLEDYPDYQEALKEKECFTYKLGQALIKANNNWYGGVYQIFI
ncbi:alpha-2,3-sialyltransferase [Campylobacter lari]|nr:alpha-2,3-sialyltransferase [Campylobacter lari]EAL7139219.1 alpha-2,3-sialyltransferase [Campylobacter lari]